MRSRVLSAIGVCLAAIVFSGSVASAAVRARGPFLLVSVASLGTVTWSCGGSRDDEVALGFRVFSMSATTTVGLVVGSKARSVVLNPGQSVRFPFLPPGRQRLVLGQATEARTLRAVVTAVFKPGQSYCFSYFPPSTSVTVRR